MRVRTNIKAGRRRHYFRTGEEVVIIQGYR